MKKLIVAALCCVAGFAPGFAAEISTVQLSETPDAARQAITNRAGTNRILSIEKTVDGDKTTYAVEIKNRNRTRDFTVDENGVLLDIQVYLGELKPHVRDAAKKEAGENSIESITKSIDGDDVTYEVEITKSGQSKTFTLDVHGSLTERQIPFSELPSPVQQAALKQAAGAKMGDAAQEFDEGKSYYEIVLNPDGKPTVLDFDAAGNVLTQADHVTLADLPSAAQSAAKKFADGGKISSLIKTVEDGETSYEVKVNRNGKIESATFDSDGKPSGE